MKPNYVIERWPHGWLLCAADGEHGLPLNALSECAGLFGKKAIMDIGIAHHFQRANGRRLVLCVSSLAGAKRWRIEIESTLASLPPQERWWKGLDVGASSAAIFACFCDSQWRSDALDYSEGATPNDADDFGRCTRLLNTFPEWRERLPAIATAYPSGDWPTIIARWSELESASPTRQGEILRSP